VPKQNYYQIGQLTDLAYLVLLTLVQPCHGYLIMSRIDELTEGDVQIGPATLYTTLRKLSEAGFIRPEKSDDNKKIYLVTLDGLQALQAEIDKRRRYADYGSRALQLYKKGK